MAIQFKKNHNKILYEALEKGYNDLQLSVDNNLHKN